MYRSGFSSVALIALLAFASPASAAPILVLSSTSDLTDLEVGSTVQINVTLAGVDPSDFIYLLYSRELFPASLFEAVPDAINSSGLTPGAILPLASQVATFNAASSLTAGSATGKFLEPQLSPALAISTNGLYYSFMLEAISPGSGMIGFDPANTFYAANSTGFNVGFLPTSAPLPFTITQVAAVPEPSTLVMLTTAAMVTVGRRWQVKRRRV